MQENYRGFVLDSFQRQAIDAIASGASVLVSAPTGTGKTLIADFLVEWILEGGGKVIYTAPIKALSNQKYRQYSQLLGEDAIGLVTGDLVIHRDAPMRVMTTEILRNILLESPGSTDGESDDETWLSRADLQGLRAVIIDEIHFLDDPERGTVWEELLIYLPADVQILGLSATLSNLDEFAGWLSSIRGDQVQVIHRTQRAVPLQFRLANREAGLVNEKKFRRAAKQWAKDQRNQDPQGRGGGGRGGGGRGRRKPKWHKYAKHKSRPRKARETRHSELLSQLDASMFPALYFIYSRKLTEKLAYELLDRQVILGGPWPEERVTEIEAVLSQFSAHYPEVLTPRLRALYGRGIGFHHAGLHVALKSLVEGLYERRLLRLLYCTSTFALGVNMPARTVVFDALTKFNGHDIVPLTVREFMQIAGRSGRRGLDDAGDVVVRMDFSTFVQQAGVWRVLTAGESEPVNSSFNLSFHSVANLLDRRTDEEIRRIVDQSFRAYQDSLIAGRLREEIEEAEDKPASHSSGRSKSRKIAGLRRQLVEAERPRLWEQFQRKVAFLHRFGYIDHHNRLTESGRILRQLHFGEILVTELILDGVVEDLTGPELFGVLCSLVQTLPRAASVRGGDAGRWEDIEDRLLEILDSEVIRVAEHMTGTEHEFCPELMQLGLRWARGASMRSLLQDIRCPTDISGDLVGAFRRAKDLARQIMGVYRDDETVRERMREMIYRVTRDEVEAIH